MKGADVYRVLQNNRVTHLHHANTVTTSCSFLQCGGLASRGFVEKRGLTQTSQYTDEADKKYGIWNDIFMDGVDIHTRASRRNLYGPVLFLLPADVLMRLPKGTEVIVTRKNPAKWSDGEQDSERYFQTLSELEAGYRYGNFGQHVIVRGPSGILPFDAQIEILLDDPQRELKNGKDAYSSAKKKLVAAVSSHELKIDKRECSTVCKWVTQYSSLYDFDSYF